jgi:CMP-N-acetylneuraminic acid synthetase
MPRQTDIAVMIAVRSGSKRVPKKNIRSFCDSSLLEIKIKQAMRLENISMIAVTSDDDEMLDIANQLGAFPMKRDPYYATDSVPMGDVYVHLASSIKNKDILWTPVTSPLIKDETIQACISSYVSLDQYDSVITTTSINEYLWLDDKAINYDPKNHPRSQDLPNVYALNFAANILPRELMIKNKNILGNKFFPYLLDDIESIDVDTEFDFMIAEMLYEKMRVK